MLTSMFFTAVLAASGTPRQTELSVTFPDQANPNFYNVMGCRGSVRQRTQVRVSKDGAPTPKSGTVVFRCNGPLTTHIQRIPFEPSYFQDTRWTWAFEDDQGKQVLAGFDARLMMPTQQGLSFYVREGYRDTP